MSKRTDILRPFFERPLRSLSIREAARLLRVSPTTASAELKAAAAAGLLTERRERNAILYQADLDSRKYRDAKVYATIRKLRDSGLLEALDKAYHKPAVVLFGSAAEGLDTETSDYDLLIISENTGPFPEEDAFEKKLKRPLQLFVFASTKKIPNPDLINNMIAGITLQGRVRWM